jgi:hypothetical protein
MRPSSAHAIFVPPICANFSDWPSSAYAPNMRLQPENPTTRVFCDSSCMPMASPPRDGAMTWPPSCARRQFVFASGTEAAVATSSVALVAQPAPIVRARFATTAQHNRKYFDDMREAYTHDVPSQ